MDENSEDFSLPKMFSDNFFAHIEEIQNKDNDTFQALISLHMMTHYAIRNLVELFVLNTEKSKEEILEEFENHDRMFGSNSEKIRQLLEHMHPTSIDSDSTR